MPLFSGFKSTFLLLFILFSTCAQEKEVQASVAQQKNIVQKKEIIVAANRVSNYLPLLKTKKIAVVANQTSVIFKNSNSKTQIPKFTHLVDSLLALDIDIKKVFAPEHGFRGSADAGELVKDGLDTRTQLPLISLYGKNKKPAEKQLEGVDLVLFDIQDVGVRFYTYIATLQLVMEACAENNIPVVVLDRPNPNGSYVDGPTMETENTSFLGMNEIPLVYGMTIGEYATMINEEGWLENKSKASLTVISLENWNHKSTYSLPIRPSPNLPNDKSINLYPSLGLFEGTTINAGRGTEFQFQRYGASFLDSTAYDFAYYPKPNFGSKHPKEEGKKCFGRDLSNQEEMSSVSLKWLIDAYENSLDKSKFFKTTSFTRHAGTKKLQQQLEAGLSETEIKATWQENLEKFKKIRSKYLLYD